MIRPPWGNNFPSVLANCRWESLKSDVPSLKRHALYEPAKGQRDIDAAMKVLDDLIQNRTLAALARLARGLSRTPFLIAPASQIEESNNALAITYAQWLSMELGWPVFESVYQTKAFAKDRSDHWTRLLHRSTFYGDIDTSRPYVLVDDVLTLGGTLADLRAFILGKGGTVIAMSVIATKDGADRAIHLSPAEANRLGEQYGNDFPEFCQTHFGFQPDGFTSPEAGKLLSCSGYVELRKGLLRAGYKADARRSSRTA